MLRCSGRCVYNGCSPQAYPMQAIPEIPRVGQLFSLKLSEMHFLDLPSAAIEIRQALDQSKRQNLFSPFFFMVGAGISHPPLPLAGQIQEDCKKEAQKYGKT